MNDPSPEETVQKRLERIEVLKKHIRDEMKKPCTKAKTEQTLETLKKHAVNECAKAIEELKQEAQKMLKELDEKLKSLEGERR